MEFYDYLYHGFTGEYQLVSSLYRNGLDAVRPPADMGIDVVSLNLKAQLEDPSTLPETFFFQVKTAVTSVQDDVDGRSIATAEFRLKDTELDLVCEGVSRALVCYVYTRENDALTNAYESPFCCFWIDGERLKVIRENGGLLARDGEAKLTLRCRLTLSPYADGHWYACVVDENDVQVREGYLGTVDSDSEATQASDGADHYSIHGYLDYAHNASADAAEEPELEVEQPAISNREAVLEALERRGIRYFAHFTKVDNLPSIFAHGIMPPAEMTRQGVAYDGTDEDRYDGMDALCLSVEFPNNKMFYRKRCHNPGSDWCVLLLDAAGVVNASNPKYFWTNAASRDFAAPGGRDWLDGIDAFERMFEDQLQCADGSCLQRTANTLDCYTTDVQAEIQVTETLPASLIKIAIFEDYPMYSQWLGQLPANVTLRFDNFEDVRYFMPRSDYANEAEQASAGQDAFDDDFGFDEDLPY